MQSIQSSLFDRNKLVEDNLDLVERVARHYCRLWKVSSLSTLAEYISVGNEALVVASKRYDPERGAGFETFAFFKIRNAIIDSIRSSNTSRVKTRLVFLPWYISNDNHIPVDDSQGGPERSALFGQVKRAIDQLPEREKQVLYDHFYLEYPGARTAKKLGLSRTHTYRLLSTSLQKLRDSLGRGRSAGRKCIDDANAGSPS